MVFFQFSFEFIKITLAFAFTCCFLDMLCNDLSPIIDLDANILHNELVQRNCILQHLSFVLWLHSFGYNLHVIVCKAFVKGYLEIDPLILTDVVAKALKAHLVSSVG